MTRLINADKLVITPIDVTDLPQDRCLRVVLWDDVENAETVDAIPIEFINKILESVRSLKITSKDIKEIENSIEFISALETLIYLWRKENETHK